MIPTELHRILIVDDNPAIHEDFRKVLGRPESADLDAAEDKLFGGTRVVAGDYELDFASQGQDALVKVCAAIAEERPYSLAFIDMRMPPGWDGVETIRHIWKNDREIQIVICTAFSDYSWQDILDRLGRSDRLLILKKPFDVAELCQLASALTQKWTLARQAVFKANEMDLIVDKRTTELRAANKELQRINQQLREFVEIESERNRLRETVHSMEQVVGIIGHELRTPLGCIRGLAELMLKTSAVVDRSSAAMLEGINTTAREMANTLDSLLEAARLHSGMAAWNWSTFALQPVCQEAVTTVRPVAPSSFVEIVQSVDPAAATMRGDPDAIRRLLVNLLGNADRHTTSGLISLEATGFPDDKDQTWIKIKVTDTGAGIPANLISRLGEPFALNRGVVGDNCVHGTGLGIAICKAIAQAHGGSLEVVSTVGKGTTVVVLLRADLPAAVQTGLIQYQHPAALAPA